MGLYPNGAASDVFSLDAGNDLSSAFRIQTGRFEEKMAKDVLKMLRTYNDKAISRKDGHIHSKS